MKVIKDLGGGERRINATIVKDLPHLQKDLSELCSHFHEGMEVSTVKSDSQSLKIVGLE